MNSILISCYTLFSLNFILTAGVIAYNFRIVRKSLASTCLYCLHITVIIDSISQIPNVYYNYIQPCKFMGWLHVYFGFANVCICAVVNFILYQTLFSATGNKIDRSKYKYFYFYGFVYGLPLITILPFSTDSYGIVQYPYLSDEIIFCGLMHDDLGNTWDLAISLVWVWVILAYTNLTFFIIIWRSYKSYSELTPRILKAFGIYPLITTISWILKSMLRVGTSDTYTYNVFVFICGILYPIVFLSFHKNVAAYEDAFDGNAAGSDVGVTLVLTERMSQQSSIRTSEKDSYIFY